jgi:hypothetical protein
MNRYELAVHEVRSALDEWLTDGGQWHDIVAKAVVERLVSKGVIQSTIENDLKDYRTGPLEPGRRIISGDSTS